VVVVMVGFQILPRRTKPCNLVLAKLQKKKRFISKRDFNQYNTNDKILMKIFPSPNDEKNNKIFETRLHDQNL
jgi:hypothetical protein